MTGVASRAGESELDRWNRNFQELLQELRVAQTGVQLLFAFLLTLVFTERFEETTTAQRVVYVVTLLASAAATGLLIAPVSYHRIAFRRNMKPHVVAATHRMASAGLAFLTVAMVGAVFLVVDVAVGRWPAVVLALAVLTFLVTLWYALPFRFRRRGTLPRSGDGRPR